MRKIIVSMNVTLDGYMCDRNSELDWHFEHWTPDMGEAWGEELNRSDTILLGRVTYEAMANYWVSKEKDSLCARDDIAFAVMMNRHHKIVYSKTLKKTEWNNSTQIKENIKDAILQLKQSTDTKSKNIIIYGSGKLVSLLMQLNLIDEYHLWVHPIILGKGKRLFKKSKNKFSLELLKSETFCSGVILLYYQLSPLDL